MENKIKEKIDKKAEQVKEVSKARKYELKVTSIAQDKISRIQSANKKTYQGRKEETTHSKKE